MTYELECGHCGFRFALEDSALTRTVKCAVCGAMLTIAVPVPIVSDTPDPDPVPVPPLSPPPPEPEPAPAPHPPPLPPPPPPPEPEPEPSFPPFVPDRPDLDDLEPWERARYLAAPWPSVRSGLKSVRVAVEFGRAIYMLYLFLGLIADPITARERSGPGDVWLSFVAFALLVPAAVHAVSQVWCAAAPRGYGSRLAGASVALVGCSLVALAALFSTSIVFAVGACAGFVVVSFALWLAFLARLGQRLDDRDMMTEVWSFNSWFWGGFVVSCGLIGVATLTDGIGAGPFVWFCRVVAGLIGLRLLRGYRALLRTAILCVERRAPVAPGP